MFEAQYGEKQHTICTYGSRIEFVVNLHSSIQGPNPSTPYDLQHRSWVVLVSARDRHKILDKFSTTHRLFQLFCFESMLQRSCEHKRIIFSEVIDVSIQSIVQFFDADSESHIPCLSNQLWKSTDTASLLRDSLTIPTKVPQPSKNRCHSIQFSAPPIPSSIYCCFPYNTNNRCT